MLEFLLVINRWVCVLSFPVPTVCSVYLPMSLLYKERNDELVKMAELILKEKNKPKTMYLKIKRKQPTNQPPNQVRNPLMSEWNLFVYQGKLEARAMVSLKRIIVIVQIQTEKLSSIK